MGVFRPETYKNGIMWSSAFNICGRSVAFVQQWLIGYYFGAYSGTDVFFFIYNLILFISFFFLNFSTAVLIPKSIRLRIAEGEHSSMTFLNAFIFLYGGIGILLFLFACIETLPFVSAISSFSETVIDANVHLIRWILPILLLNMLTSLMTEILASYKYFTFPNLINLINSSLGVLFVLLFHDMLGLKSVSIGLVFGYVVNILLVLIMMKRLLKWKMFSVSFKHVKSALKTGCYTQLGYLVYLMAMFVPQYFFTSFPEGSLTAISFADKMTNIPSIFLVGQILSVMAIKYNNLVGKGHYQEVARLTEKLLLSVMSGLFVVAVGVSLLSGWLVEVLFGIGKFTTDSLDLTARILSMQILYLPFLFVYNMFMRIFNAYQLQRVYVWVQLFAQGTIIVLYCWLIPEYGAIGYPLSLALPYITVAYFVVPLFKRYCPEMRVGRYYAFLVVFTVVFAVYYYHAFFA